MTRFSGYIPKNLRKRFAIIAYLEEFALVRSREVYHELRHQGIDCTETLVITVLAEQGWQRIKSSEKEVWWVRPEVVI